MTKTWYKVKVKVKLERERERESHAKFLSEFKYLKRERERVMLCS